MFGDIVYTWGLAASIRSDRSQCRPVSSAMYPPTERTAEPRHSLRPAMMLMAAAVAPSKPMNGPFSAAPPSQVISAKRLTRPSVRTKRKAEPAPGVFFDMRGIAGGGAEVSPLMPGSSAS